MLAVFPDLQPTEYSQLLKGKRIWLCVALILILCGQTILAVRHHHFAEIQTSHHCLACELTDQLSGGTQVASFALSAPLHYLLNHLPVLILSNPIDRIPFLNPHAHAPPLQ